MTTWQDLHRFKLQSHCTANKKWTQNPILNLESICNQYLGKTKPFVSNGVSMNKSIILQDRIQTQETMAKTKQIPCSVGFLFCFVFHLFFVLLMLEFYVCWFVEIFSVLFCFFQFLSFNSHFLLFFIFETEKPGRWVEWMKGYWDELGEGKH